MTKTVKEHLTESDRVSEIVNEANALVKKLQAELAISRTTLEELSEMQHPKLSMRVPYAIRNKTLDDSASPKSIISCQVDRISALLGDRA